MIHVTRLFSSVVRNSKSSVVCGLTALMLFAGGAQAQLSVAVGTTSATQTATITATTAGKTATTAAVAFPVLTQGATGLDFSFVSGGTCAVSTTYSQDFTCNIKYTFKPRFSGVRYGAVELVSDTGVVMGTTYISGVGTGPQAIFSQPAITTLPGSFNSPRSMAVDGAGDVYVANFGGGNVVKIPAGCATSSCVTTVGIPFSGPASVAVDGAGNIYVAAFSSGVVSMMPPGCSSNSCITQVGGGFEEPIGITVDGSGNVFVADFETSIISKVPQSCSTTSCVKQLTVSSSPQDVAVDGNGTIYVANYGASLIQSLPASCNINSCPATTLGAGFNIPSGVTVDGNGNVYVGDSGNNAVKMMTPNCTPANASTCVTTLYSTLNGPIGVMLDAGGDLYIADNGNNAVREIPRATVPSLVFGNTNDGSAGTPQTVTLTNYGNLPLSIAVPSSGLNPSVSSGFTVATTGTNACPSVSAGGSAVAVAANASCNLFINFNPELPDNGTVSGSVIVTDNNANVAGSTQAIGLSGSATKLVPVITSISPTDGLLAGGTTVTINGTELGTVTAVHFGSTAAMSFQLMSDSQMTAVSPAEAAAVVDIQVTNFEGQSLKNAGDQFTYTNTLLNTITFPALASATFGGTAPTPAATATSGQAVSYASATLAACSISGTTITIHSPGICTITASQAATGHFAAAAPVSQSFQVILIQSIGVKTATLQSTLTFTTAVAAGTAFTTNVTTLGATGQDFNVQTGGTCVSGTAYAVGATCTVDYTFKPLAAGARSGGITLTTGSGASSVIVASTYIGGEGTGPQLIYSTFVNQLNASQGPFAVDGNGATYVLLNNSSGYFIIVTPAGCQDSSCETQITLPAGTPRAIALDGIGNLYLADANGTVSVLPPGCLSACVSLLPTLPSSLFAITLDSYGNVYVGGSNGLTEIPTGCFSSSCYEALGGGIGDLTADYTIAVDFTGNVYAAVPSTNVVDMLTPNCLSASCVTSLGVGAFTQPSGVAVDPNGNVYVSDFDSATFLMPANCLNASCVQNILPVGSPFGIHLDAQGNVDLASQGGQYPSGVIQLTRATPPPVLFRTTQDGTTSQPQTIAITNYGNQALVFSVPSSGNNPAVSPNFALQTGVSGECAILTNSSSATSLAPSASCSLPIVFAPVAPAAGTRIGTVTLTDNNLNGTSATQAISLSGTAAAQPTVTGVSPASGSSAGGTAVTITGTNFVSGATAAFGGVAATSVVVNSTTSLTAVSPAGSLGTVNVTVANGTLTSVTSAADQFTYVAPPTVTGVSPAFGSPNGATTVTLTGTGFVKGSTTVSFGGKAATGVIIISTTSISANSPAGTGTVDVTVTTGGVPSPASVADQFSYLNGQKIGQTGPTQTATVTISEAGTLGAIDVLTTGQPNLDYTFVTGGTCAVNTVYAVNATCTVKYTFKAKAPGVRLGAVQLVASGNVTPLASVLGTTLISGLGTGAAVAYPTNQTMTTLGSGFAHPYDVAVDAAGNVYVADFNNNAVKEILASDGSVLTLGSGFNEPTGIAVDGAGNVYVGDFGHAAVKEIVAVAGSIPTTNPVILALGVRQFFSPLGVAVDGAGNVYVTDATVGSVSEIVAASGNVVQLANGLGNPQGVAVDAFGNVFVADFDNHAVKEIDAASGNVVTLGSGFVNPNWVAVDAAGDVYVADGASGTVSEIVAVGGIIPTSNPTILTLGTGFTTPTGVSVDAVGNVYVADNAQTAIVEIATATAPSLSFATTKVGNTSSDSPQSFSLQNIGNVSLSLTVPSSGQNPSISAGFTQVSTCPIVNAGGGVTSVAEGALCTESISFTPVAGGLDNGSLTFTDNALNAVGTTQVIGLSGTGALALTVSSVSPSSGSAAGGNLVTITGTNFASGMTVSFGGTAATNVTLLSGTGITAVSPAGNVGPVDVTVTSQLGTSATSSADQFTYTAIASTIAFPALGNAVIGATAPVPAATSNSPQTITYTSTTTSVCTVSAGIITDLAGGTCSITASQAAGGNYAAATPVSQSYTVLVPFVFITGNGKLESLASNGGVTSSAVGNGGIGAAVDSSGHVWSVDSAGTGISRFSSLGAGNNDYNKVGLVGASAVAIDGNSQVWVANGNGQVMLLSNAGAVVSTTQGSTTAAATGIAIDISGNVWITNNSANTVDEVIGGAAPASPLSTAVTNNKTGTRP